MRRISALIFLFVILTSGVIAQSGNDSTELSSFRKGWNLVGMLFTASRTQMIGFINNIAEILGVGPWYRLYLGKEPNIAFFLQADLLYTNYYGESIGVQSLVSIDENLDVAGIRGALGVGLSYVMGDRVAFDVGFVYTQARYWGVLQDNILGYQQDVVLDRGGFLFSFGFNILFNKLKQDDE